MNQPTLQEQLVIQLSRMVEYLAVAADDGAYDQEIEAALALIARAEGET